MSFKAIKFFCISICVILGLSLMVTPLTAETKQGKRMGLHEFLQTLPEETREQVNCILDTAFKMHDDGFKKMHKSEFSLDMKLEDVLTPEQLQQFKDIFTRKPLSATAATTCGDCYWPNYFIFKALQDIEDAIATFISSGHYCETAPNSGMLDPYYYVITAMARARTYLISAENYSWGAYQTCDCQKATNANAVLGLALYYISKAISDSNFHCDPLPPWMTSLSSAQIRANNASVGLQDCIDQACN